MKRLVAVLQTVALGAGLAQSLRKTKVFKGLWMLEGTTFNLSLISEIG